VKCLLSTLTAGGCLGVCKMNGIKISKETFEKLGVEEKLNALFDVHISTFQRIEKLEKRRWYDPIKALGFGGVAGFLGGWFGR